MLLSRYLTNDTFKGHSKSPIFFYTGNEGNIELFAKNSGFIWELAQDLGASLGTFIFLSLVMRRISFTTWLDEVSFNFQWYFYSFYHSWSLFSFFSVFAEHRYYGESLPFGNLSFSSPEYSGYLTSEQALADYADLLTNSVNTNSRPVIAFGGSYGGMLSAWFRMKYPHVVTGSIAASAPILQFTADCNRFNTILTSVFSANDRHCSENIRKSWKIIK